MAFPDVRFLVPVGWFVPRSNLPIRNRFLPLLQAVVRVCLALAVLIVFAHTPSQARRLGYVFLLARSETRSGVVCKTTFSRVRDC